MMSCAILEIIMKFFDLHFIKKTTKTAKKRTKFIDSYQESLNKLGREQLKSLLEKGIELQPISLAH